MKTRQFPMAANTDKGSTADAADPQLPLQSEADTATATLVANAKMTGTDAALTFLRNSFDDDVHVLASFKPGRNSRSDDVSKVLVEINGNRHVIMVESFESGAFKLYVEVSGKPDQAMADRIGDFYHQPIGGE